MRKRLLGTATALAIAALPVRAFAYLPVIDPTAIGQLISQLAQQQAINANTLGTYQQSQVINTNTWSTWQSVSGLTGATGWAPGLNLAGLQNPLSALYSASAYPGYIGGVTSPYGLPFGSTYQQQLTLPVTAGTSTTPFTAQFIPWAISTLPTAEATATQNLQALEQRAQQLPSLVSELDSANTVQLTTAVNARLTGENNYATLQAAQAENLATATRAQIAAMQLYQTEAAYAQGQAGEQSLCTAYSETGMGSLPGCTGATVAPTTAAAIPGF
jgi:hypothetical protein